VHELAMLLEGIDVARGDVEAALGAAATDGRDGGDRRGELTIADNARDRRGSRLRGIAE
jgi:hypothetical protein